jgi:ribosomal protein L32
LPDRNAACSVELEKEAAGSKTNQNDLKTDPISHQTSVPKAKAGSIFPNASSDVLGPVTETANDSNECEMRVHLKKLTANEVKRWTEPKATKKRGLLAGCRGGPCKKKKKLSDTEEPIHRAENRIITTNHNKIVGGNKVGKTKQKTFNEKLKLPKTRRCSICGEKISNHRNMFYHQANIHFDKSIVERYAIDLKDLSCTICRLKFNQKQHLLRHMATEHGVLNESGLQIRKKPKDFHPPELSTFSCQLCPKQYVNQVSFFSYNILDL